MILQYSRLVAILFRGMKRETERLLTWGLLFGTGLVALVAGIFLIWPQKRLADTGAEKPVELVSPSSPPVATPTPSPERTGQLSTQVDAVTVVSTPRPTPADPLPRKIPPGADVREISAIYLDVSERYAAASEKLKELLKADPEILDVMAKKIQTVAPALEFVALADMFEDRHLRPLMLENLRLPSKFQDNVLYGVQVVEGGEVNFRDTTTPEQQADQFALANPLYRAQYQRLVTKLDVPAEYTDILPDSLGGWRVKAILEEYMGEYGYRFDERQRQFVPA